ncbi:hybrid sensor histidine kinase/response regulator [Pedobacter sp.]|jgi:signal transduction histidine kinase/ActR/RegA family two-component response regulator|uniref:ATP-binding response regulator n=1 Tax=Pedobacter sp. TaxID=1411316 RepID=UPI002B73B647|nr:hybrid sensor histidine kinase/response regulator [Pedobacter sp.]HWW37845.1 hybrid sensor histidine kinase/response regulator [Pedobacter sp.]
MKLLKITDVIDRITLAGTIDLPRGAAKQIKVINSLCLITAILAFTIGNIFYYKTGLLAIEIPAMIEGTLFCSVIFLHRRKRHTEANLAFVIVHCISALCFGAILGATINLLLIDVFLISVSFIIFSDLKNQLISCSFILISIIPSEANLYYGWIQPVELSRPNQFFIRWIALAVFLFFNIIILVYYIRERLALQKRQEANITKQAKLLRQLNTANEIIKIVFFKLSHEMRNQINPIALVVDILKGMIDKNTTLLEVEPYIDIIATSVNNTSTIINNTLTFSEIEAGKLYEPTFTTFNINNLIRKIIAQHIPSADKKGLNIEYRIQNGLFSIVVMDEMALRVSLTNLLNNAIKYAYPYTNIYIHLSLKDTNCHLAVSNSCEDISIEKQENLFSPFVRNKDSQHAEGTGLGLYVVKKLMTDLNGNVLLRSKNGVTKFSLLFPIMEGIETDIVPEINLNISLNGFNVLIADDEQVNLFLLEKLLIDKGCNVRSAENGVEVLEKLKESLPNLIILDVNMPIMDGRETLKQLRKDPTYKEIPVMIATGDAFDPTTIQAWQELGAKDVLQKPITWRVLASTLKRYITPKAPITTGI